jgi:hypothetical protein
MLFRAHSSPAHPILQACSWDTALLLLPGWHAIPVVMLSYDIAVAQPVAAAAAQYGITCTRSMPCGDRKYDTYLSKPVTYM